MNEKDELSLGDFQEAKIALCRETYPDQLNVTYTRGFVSSQALSINLRPCPNCCHQKTVGSLNFKPTASNASEALLWMGFEARAAILRVLDKAVADKSAEVRVVAYDLNEPEVVTRLEKLGSRLKVIIDDDGSHGQKNSNENEAEGRLRASAGNQNVKRQHMGKLQHNKFIAVGGVTKLAVCGSTNFSWRGFYVQSNNAVVFQGQPTLDLFLEAFDSYWKFGKPVDFGKAPSREMAEHRVEEHRRKNCVFRLIPLPMLSSNRSLMISANPQLLPCYTRWPFFTRLPAQSKTPSRRSRKPKTDLSMAYRIAKLAALFSRSRMEISPLFSHPR
jgi:hypothetical protein